MSIKTADVIASAITKRLLIVVMEVTLRRGRWCVREAVVNWQSVVTAPADPGDAAVLFLLLVHI